MLRETVEKGRNRDGEGINKESRGMKRKGRGWMSRRYEKRQIRAGHERKGAPKDVKGED